ncbi:hypothetical protein RhiirA4_547923 [Rhizophagus irregularis]|uniref:Uncharacterized protein n=1 Tax=Rhizophagus irregularis TaxID=588596 RepID=A0A2I1H4Y1_9GLOM|nr:hypothetical protein RhiirA4_547923 [Rhizophagus irregularis]
MGLVSRKARCLLSASTAFFVVRLNKIFDVEIDNNLTVDNQIKDTRQDFRQIAKEFLWIEISNLAYQNSYRKVVLERDPSDTGLLLSESELPRRILPSYHELEHAQEKRKADEAFDYDVYGIVTTATDALNDQTELRKNVKRILEVIVGLLKDRVSASEEPANKKRRVEEIIKKK